MAALLLGGLPLLLWHPKSATPSLNPADYVAEVRQERESKMLDQEARTPVPSRIAADADSTSNPNEPPHASSEVIKRRVSEMTPEEKAKFEKVFADKIKPAVERWCAVYAGRAPFKPEDLTMDKFKEWIFPGGPGEGYAFVVNGTTITFDVEDGNVVLDYIMASAAARLFQVPDHAPPPQQGSVSMDEVLRLLKADSGRDFPPDELLLIPTGFSSAMNGGLQVFAGKGVRGIYGLGSAEYNLVFDPDGNLAYYLWDPPAKRPSHSR